jgi:hypothetical protein
MLDNYKVDIETKTDQVQKLKLSLETEEIELESIRKSLKGMPLYTVHN